MVPKRSSAVVVGLVGLLLLSGCLAGQPLNETQERQIADKFEQRIEGIDSYSATMETTITMGNETRTSRAKVTVDVDTGAMRQKVLAPEKRAGDVVVSNGSYTWFYDASENTVRTFDTPGRAVRGNVGKQLDSLLQRYDVIYNGTATLDGRKTYKVTLVPSNESSTAFMGRMTMWLDTDRMFPLKIHTETTGETGVSLTIRYENLTLNPDIPTGTFEFDPPAGATVKKTSSVETSNYESRSALAEATSQPVPDPDVPEGYAFERGTVVARDDVTSVTVRYSNGSDSLTVTVQDATGGDDPDGERVSVGDHTGYYQELGRVAMVQWACGGHRYAVIGHLGKADLLAVARSIEC